MLVIERQNKDCWDELKITWFLIVFFYLKDRFYPTHLNQDYHCLWIIQIYSNSKVNLFNLVYRIPQYILQKRCLSLHCLFLSPESNRFYENDAYSSAAIKIQVPVLFRDTFLSPFRVILEDVGVGCTCVTPLYINW